MVNKSLNILLILCFLLLHSYVYAQEQQVLITQKGGATFLYQSKDLKGGLVLDVYRKEGKSDYQKLNKDPIERVKDGFSFRNAIGIQAYEELAENLETENAMATYLNVINDGDLSALISFSNVKAATALGYLFIDETSAINASYTYKLLYKNNFSEVVNDSIIIDYNSQPYIPKPPVEIGIAVVDGESLEIKWQLPVSAENDYINAFNLYAESEQGRLIKLNNNLILKTNQTNFSYRFELPFDNSAYTFYVKSHDMTGQESEKSASVKMTLKDQTPPEPVSALVAKSNKGNAPLLTWRVNLENDLMGYNVYRAPRTIDEFEKINETLISPYETYYQDESVNPGRQYAYAVTAVDSAGNESEKISRTTVFIEDYEVPDAPQNLTATYNRDNGNVLLSWDFAYEAQDFRTFLVTRQVNTKRSKGSLETVNADALRESNYIDNGPTKNGFIPGYIYNYTVVAIDDSQNRSDTAKLTFQIPDFDPPQPPEITARNDDGHRINITWTASPDYDVVAYKVYRSSNGIDTILAENHYSQRLHRDENAQKGNTYIYTVTAIDSLGNEGPKSAADTIFMKDEAAPAPTRNVFATAQEQGVVLKWEPVPDQDVEGYLIYKSEIATGVYNVINDNLTNAVSFTDENGIAGDWYKIVAVDTSGNEAFIRNGVQAIKRENP